ncbi:MAG: hypothetical protein K2X90_03835 [Candidatus Babeliaceae bacterium]|nr:hypothetical protein [Candidatus Babeliaceae bacterium]
MNYRLFFLCFLSLKGYADYSALQLFLLATNPADAAALYPNIKPQEFEKSRPAKTKAATPEIKAAIEKKSTGGAAAGCLTKEEAQKIVGAPLPDIANAAAAKAELVKFFEPGNTGGKLLTEIGATPQQAEAVKNAIATITAKA